jgi:hypothetical protein
MTVSTVSICVHHLANIKESVFAKHEFVLEKLSGDFIGITNAGSHLVDLQAPYMMSPPRIEKPFQLALFPRYI